jgi:hypothetical protein
LPIGHEPHVGMPEAELNPAARRSTDEGLVLGADGHATVNSVFAAM